MGIAGSGVITASFYTGLNLVLLGVLIVKLFALIDAAIRPRRAFEAADKMTKVGWLIILGLCVVVDLVAGGIFSLLTIAGLIATIVYLVDARPALRQVAGKGRDRSSSSGPYGPW